MAEAKRVVVQLPGVAKTPNIAKRYEIEQAEMDRIGATLVESDTTDTDELIELFRDADAILTSWGVPITERIIGELKQCVIIGVGSIGVDMIDVEAATQAGIVVTNTPDIFIEEVADHAMMLLLAQNKVLKGMMIACEQGKWAEMRPIPSAIPRLWGQTLGLLGFGNVGVAVARRALPFGMHVIANDPYVSELKMSGEHVEPVTFEELIQRSDYLSIHAPDNPGTHHLISTKELKAMKSTAFIVNTARGPLIDEKALIKALNDGEIAGAGLDVTEKEPPEKDNPLRNMANVVMTPHSASASTRMRQATRTRAAREVALALTGRWPMSCVNPDVQPRTPLQRWQPFSMERGPNR